MMVVDECLDSLLPSDSSAECINTKRQDLIKTLLRLIGVQCCFDTPSLSRPLFQSRLSNRNRFLKVSVLSSAASWKALICFQRIGADK